MVSEITTITMAAMFTAVAVALFINYLMTALGYMGCMKKAGVESWKAWIPVYNEYVMYKVVNLKGFLIIFKILYLIVATVYLCFTFSFIAEITEKADELVNNSSYTREASVSQNNVYRNKVKSTEVNVDIDDEEFLEMFGAKSVGIMLFGMLNTIFGIGVFVISILFAINISKSYGLGGGTIAGMILIPTIFILIIGFGNSTYQGNYKEQTTNI